MQESSIYQHWLETTEERFQEGLKQGADLGARQNALESLFSVLDFKFEAITVRLLQPALEKINDINVLKQLHDAALRVESLEAFVEYLDTCVNGS